jgi:hypothetical protein
MIKFMELHSNDGLDPNASPRPWLMVRHTSQKLLRLQGLPARTRKVVLTPDKPNIVDVSFANGIARIRGTGVGTCTVSVEIDGVIDLDSMLDVNVKAMKTVKASFYFVSDNAHHKTTRNKSIVDGLISRLNLIHLPQNNVHFTKGEVKALPIGQDLGPVVRWAKNLPGVPNSEDEWDLLVGLRDSDADWTVFFVWEYESDTTPNTDNTDAGTLNGITVFEDSAGTKIGDTLAHEAGHFLGAPDRTSEAEKGLLMFGITDRRGTKINKVDANRMNPSGVASP